MGTITITTLLFLYVARLFRVPGTAVFLNRRKDTGPWQCGRTSTTTTCSTNR
jgi:hypothetical protein